MLSLEVKAIELVEKHLGIFLACAGAVIALIIRISMYPFISSDMEGYLLGWFAQIELLGGIRALDVQVGNYSVAYQTLIALMTYLPVDAMIQYKNLSVFFDYVLAAGTAMLVYDCTGKDKRKSIAVFLFVLFSPLTFINSAAWGQCDAIYTAFVVWALYFFRRERYNTSFVLYGLACAFKLQAVFVLPFFLFAYVRKKSFSAMRFLIIPAVMELVCVPAMLMGRGVKAAFSVYYYQTFSCDKMFFNYPSLWTVISDQYIDGLLCQEYRRAMRTASIVFTVAVLMLLMGYYLYRRVQVKGRNVVYLSFLFVYTCVLFLPGMHERYGFVYEILALVIAILLPRTSPLAILMYCLTAITYGQSLFGGGEVTRMMGVINILIYVAYLAVLSPKMVEEL